MKRTILMLILCATNAVAQGTMLWTFHSNGNTIHPIAASFEVSESALISGGSWSPEAMAEVSLTAIAVDFWGNAFSSGNSELTGWGTGSWLNTWEFSFSQYNSAVGYEMDWFGYNYPNYSFMSEFDPGVGELVEDWGNWTWAPVPEPGFCPLALLGALMIWKRRRRAQ